MATKDITTCATPAEAGIDIEIGLLMTYIKEAARIAVEKIKAQFFVIKLWLAVILLGYSLLCFTASYHEWHGIPALLFVLLTLGNAIVAFSAKGIGYSGSSGAIVNGTPGMTIGQLLTAPFTDEKWPDFKTKDFLTAGLEMTKKFWLAQLHLTIVAGLVAEFSELVTLHSMAGVIVMLLPIIVLVAFSLTEKVTETKWYKRIVIGMSVPTLIVGLVMAIYPLTRTESMAEKIQKENAVNKDLAAEERLQAIWKKVHGNKGRKGVMTKDEEIAVNKAVNESGSVISAINTPFTSSSKKTFSVIIKDLGSHSYPVPNGTWTFRLVDASPIVYGYIPDASSNTGKKAVRNDLKDPSYTLVAGEGTVNGGKITVADGKVAFRLRVPPDTEENLKTGNFKIGESTVNVAFE